MVDRIVAGPKLAAQALRLTEREDCLRGARGAPMYNLGWFEDNKRERVAAVRFVMMTGGAHGQLAARHNKELTA